MAKTYSVTLFLDPLTYHLEHDRLFDVDNSPTSGERILEPYVHLRAWLAERGVATHTGDLLERGDVEPSELNLYATMGMRTRYRTFAAPAGHDPERVPRQRVPDRRAPTLRRAARCRHALPPDVLVRRRRGDAAVPPSAGLVSPLSFPLPVRRRRRGGLGARGPRLPRDHQRQQGPPARRPRALQRTAARCRVSSSAAVRSTSTASGGTAPRSASARRGCQAPSDGLAYLAERRWDRLRPSATRCSPRRAARGAEPSRRSPRRSAGTPSRSASRTWSWRAG